MERERKKWQTQLNFCPRARELWVVPPAYPQHMERWILLSIMCNYAEIAPSAARTILLDRYGPWLKDCSIKKIQAATHSYEAYWQYSKWTCRCAYHATDWRVATMRPWEPP